MKFIIYKVTNGYLLNIHIGKKSESRVYMVTERMTMFAYIDKLMGNEPIDSTGMELEEIN